MAISGLKVVEFAGLAPGPFAGLILADNGASVTRIDRPGSTSADILCRGKRSIAINPKIPSGREALKKLIANADVLIDPFRPGVLERLGLGPEVFLGSQDSNGNKGINEGLIYARIVGFPRTGPHKDMAGHDINYLALSGVLSILPGSDGKPSFPLNLLADFAGGGLMCTLGILLALIERGKSGRGQVVEADMVSGSRYLSSFPLLHILSPSSQHFSGLKILAGGAPFYDVYTCKGGGIFSVGCLEPQFFRAFIERFVPEVEKVRKGDGWIPSTETQSDFSEWPKMRQYFQQGFMTQDRDFWAKVFHASDACAVPVLTPEEAANLDASKSSLPIPHPQLSRTPSVTAHTAQTSSSVEKSLHLTPGSHTTDILRESGFSDQEVDVLLQDGALGNKRQAKL